MNKVLNMAYHRTQRSHWKSTAKHGLIALVQAVRSGIIISRTKMDGLICSEKIPPAFIVSVYGTEKKADAVESS